MKDLSRKEVRALLGGSDFILRVLDKNPGINQVTHGLTGVIVDESGPEERYRVGVFTQHELNIAPNACISTGTMRFLDPETGAVEEKVNECWVSVSDGLPDWRLAIT